MFILDLGFLLSTTHPVVAVVSGSMEHDAGFDDWWEKNKDWYLKNEINEEQFRQFSLKNGFNKGDIMILIGKDAENVMVGDVMVL